jgi:hypothetical protein
LCPHFHVVCLGGTQGGLPWALEAGGTHSELRPRDASARIFLFQGEEMGN